MEGTAPPILGRDILPDSRLDRRLSRAFSTCAPLHLHCLIFFPDSVRVIPLVSTVMVTPPPWNGPPVSFALSWARLPSVRRSEEHTSELQSLMRISYAVFCLKQKKNKTNNTNKRTY